MNKLFKTIRTKLILWYVGSIAFFTIFFYTAVHRFSLPHSSHIYLILFGIFAIIGTYIVLHITKSITYLSSRIRDISHKNLDERIENMNSHDEIGELAGSFNGLLDNLNDAFKREQQFIGDVAHELKTPLATLKSSLEVTLSKDRDNKEYREVLEDALLETDHISQTLKNILDLAWFETPNKQDNKKRFNLSEMIDDLYEIAQKLALKKNIKVDLSTTNKIYISGFKDKFARSLMNIIENAIKYTPTGGRVEIILEKTPTKILITVTDNGQGIHEEDIPHIFTRFYRGSKTDKILGSGLGLAIAKSIIELHDGEIKVISKKGKGSSFIVILPKHN